MKRYIYLLSFLLLLIQLQAKDMGGRVITVKASNVGELSRSMENSISASLDGSTVTVMFASDFGPVDITVETASGNVVTSTSCLITPNDAVLEVSGTGNFTLTITTAAGTFTGQFTIN